MQIPRGHSSQTARSPVQCGIANLLRHDCAKAADARIRSWLISATRTVFRHRALTQEFLRLLRDLSNGAWLQSAADILHRSRIESVVARIRENPEPRQTGRCVLRMLRNDCATNEEVERRDQLIPRSTCAARSFTDPLSEFSSAIDSVDYGDVGVDLDGISV